MRLSQVDLDALTELVTESWRPSAPKRLLAAYDAGNPPRHSGRSARAIPPARDYKMSARIAAEQDVHRLFSP